MTTTVTNESVANTAKSAAKRPRNRVPLAPGSTRDAKRLAAAILEVFAGLRTPEQAAEALGMSLARYYQVEARAMLGMLEACEPKPRGRQADPAREITSIRRENERLRRDLGRQQALVRVAQRTIGLNPPAPPKPAPKSSGKKSRKRKPVVRALTMAARLQQEATAVEPPHDSGVSSPTPEA
jgi:hypothetical protein